MKKYIFTAILGTILATTGNLKLAMASDYPQQPKMEFSQPSGKGLVVFTTMNTMGYFVLGVADEGSFRSAAQGSLDCLYIDTKSYESNLRKGSKASVNYAPINTVSSRHFDHATITMINSKRPAQCKPIIGITSEDEIAGGHEGK